MSEPMNTYQTDNIFAKILRGEIACEKVFEDKDTITFMDIMPQSEGHLLVVPKQASLGLLDAEQVVIGPLFTTVQKLAKAAKIAFYADGITIMQFNGASAGQTVFHLHVHIIPRYDNVPLRAHGTGTEKATTIKLNAEKIKNVLNEMAE
jgi:histidine triad (HIT) family protein